MNPLRIFQVDTKRSCGLHAASRPPAAAATGGLAPVVLEELPGNGYPTPGARRPASGGSPPPRYGSVKAREGIP
jgi:hypothetical protein